MRSWIRPTPSVAVVVMIVYVGTIRFGSSLGSDFFYRPRTARPAPASTRRPAVFSALVKV
jgi:hypothetical protein